TTGHCLYVGRSSRSSGGSERGWSRPVGACSARGQIVVDLIEGRLRRVREADLLCERDDLLLRETLELLAGLPHVNDPNPVIRLCHPMKETAREMPAPGGEAHLLDDLVVLLERGSLEILDQADSHQAPPWDPTWTAPS